MKKIVCFCFSVFLFLSGLQAQELFGIRFFEGTFERALERAAKEKKVVFIDAYASWCGPCKAMSRNVFTNREVGIFFNANFINLKIDWESPLGSKMQAKYPIRAYPTLIYLDGKGKPLAVSEGYQDARALLSQAQAVVDKAKKQ
ncbi:MAG: thioredoxin family protein [Prevotellaceae bacterium]|jgi:thiol:disulfide interchange protein|nr:thioredoxin family protein [Prevotellaceae bacterium]